MSSLQEVLRQVPQWKQYVPKASHKVLSLIERCHSAALGYHLYRCQEEDCHHLHLQYHSCRNRHCPHCGSQRAQVWMEDRLKELLPVPYFHVVFTLPKELKKIAYINRKSVFKLLFDSSAHCLLTLSKDKKRLGGTPSITSVLHTWGQQLDFHPHIHCIVSGGGATSQNNWLELKKRKKKKKYLFPYQVMEPLYKGYFLDQLNRMILAEKVKLPKNCNWKKLKNELYEKKWIVYAKQPMGNAAQVVEYLGRYTQKIAISNYRIKEIDEQKRVHFWYKDYKDGGKKKLMQLEAKEFLRRYVQHILPPRFVRIRHYGILGNSKRKVRIAEILSKMKVPQHPEKISIPWQIAQLCKVGESGTTCPKCKKAKLALLTVVQVKRVRDGPVKPNSNFV